MTIETETKTLLGTIERRLSRSLGLPDIHGLRS